MSKFREVEVPAGNYIGWGRVGQTVTMAVVSFSSTGGSDFFDNPCPEVVGTLTEDSESWTEKGSKKVELKAGTLVTVTGGLANLKKGLNAADPKKGDLLRLTYVEDVKVDKGTVKVIRVEIAPGAANEDDDL